MSISDKMVKGKKNETKKIQVTFTNAQLDEIDKILYDGLLGSTRADVVKQIVFLHINKHRE